MSMGNGDGVHQKASEQDCRCLVFWGLEPEEEQFFINFVKDFEDDPIPEEGQERDDMTFFYGTRTRMYNDQVQLATNSPLEKLSISFALAQSTKLSVRVDSVARKKRGRDGVLELRVEETFENTRTYPQVQFDYTVVVAAEKMMMMTMMR
eukprot:758346-Hanusia_phi.AAC.2